MAVSRAWSQLLPLGIGAIVILGAGAVGFLRHAESGGSLSSISQGAGTTSTAEAVPSEPHRVTGKISAASGTAATEARVSRSPGTGTSATGDPRHASSPDAARQADVEQLRSRVLDEQLDPALRIRELETLRQRRGLNPRVAEAMLKLLPRTSDDRLRSKILKGLKGDRSDAYKFEALSRLTQDPSPLVRTAAAGSLHAFRSDALIAQALENASRSDLDPGVRHECELSLTGPEETDAPSSKKPPADK